MKKNSILLMSLFPMLLLSMLLLVSCTPFPEDLTSNYSCLKDEDCLLASFAEEDCCFYLCGSSDLVNQQEDQLREEWRNSNCGLNYLENCPIADCGIPKFVLKPYCDEGKCSAEYVKYE